MNRRRTRRWDGANGHLMFISPQQVKRQNIVLQRSSGQVCVACGQRSENPDLDGWHVFSDGVGEEHALCLACGSASPVRMSPPPTSSTSMTVRHA